MRFSNPITPAELIAWVEDFMSRPQVESDRGGWAPVSDVDLGLLARIIDGMIALHWGPDADGDRPVRAYLNDRTQFEPWPWVPVPYWTAGESIEAFLLATMRNASAASARLTLALEFAEARRRDAERADNEAASALMLAHDPGED